MCETKRLWSGAISLICRGLQLGGVMLMTLLATGADTFADDIDDILIPARQEWRYFAKPSTPPKQWMQPDFDATSWPTGVAGFGYGDEDDRTDLDSMQGRFATVMIRRSFDIAHPATVEQLYLYARYDDGFVGYLNGREVVRAGVEKNWGSVDVSDHEADGFEEFVIDVPSGLLSSTANVLAIQGFNRSQNSSDFSLDVVLTLRATETPGVPPRITREEAVADLAELEHRLEDQSSYLHLRGFDYRSALKTLSNSLDDRVETWEFAGALQRLIAQIGDAHAGVDTRPPAPQAHYLPFVVADSRYGMLALTADSSGFLAPGHPLLTAIDGRSIQEWMTVAGRYAPQASPQLIRYRGLKELQAIDQIRRDLGLPAADSVRVSLQALDGSGSIERIAGISRERLSRGLIPLGDTRLLAGNIGYLRLAKMRNSRIDEALEAMDDFRDSKGLIIDVRDNAGGRYGLLHALYGYFVPADSPPYVANIAAYRLSPRFDDDHLNYRPTYRRGYAGWTNHQLRAIDQAMARFQPEWELPDAQFSDWHFMLLERSGDRDQYYYKQPVAVLCNAGSFSATDGFLSAFADLPQVELIGEPSSGGSGATKDFELDHSGLVVDLSSAASFRPSGRLFDGHGIDVDIAVTPEPSDFLGSSDAALERALVWIEQQLGD